jgi:hypothetical protein
MQVREHVASALSHPVKDVSGSMSFVSLKIKLHGLAMRKAQSHEFNPWMDRGKRLGVGELVKLSAHRVIECR